MRLTTAASRRLVATLSCLLIASLGFTVVAANAGKGKGGKGKGKAKTEVEIDFYLEEDEDEEDEYYVYEVEIVKPKKCKKGRMVTVFHDENRNGKFDKGEFVLGQGVTNKRGRLSFDNDVAPPSGDRIGVIVEKNKKCKAGKESTKA